MRLKPSISVALLAAAFSACSCGLQSQTIRITPDPNGPVFDGIGAISGGGGNSRLLIDYPEPYRSQILDYLFKPQYGASLQILKVEIGGDSDSTDGSEPSHMHTPADENYNRGYEWWLMEQARARNPQIKLVALPWGAPSWVGHGNYWSQDMIGYIIRWLQHAQSDHHLKIDYIGGRNEHGFDAQWYTELKSALRASGLSSVKVIASDDWEKEKLWAVAASMTKFPAVKNSIDIVGAHGPGWGGYPTPEAISLNKPLWDSESHFDENPPYNEAARNINRNFIAGQVTATIFWPIVSAIYDNLPYDNIGFIKCNQPWSGNYTVTPSLWVIAHTTQFTRPGWRYVRGSSGFFAGDVTGAHGSYVTLQSPDSSSFSTVIETVQATGPQIVRFKVAGFSSPALHLWTTQLHSNDSHDWFVRMQDIVPEQEEFSLTLEPGRMYTISTTSSAAKGDAVTPPPAPLKLPYADDFKSGEQGHSARYFSDVYGSFELMPCKGGRAGTCLEQRVPAEPIAWKDTSGRPFTMIGSLDWSDYRVSADVLFTQAGSADIIARIGLINEKDNPDSYVLRIGSSGEWWLLKTSSTFREVVLASGRRPPLGLNQWHRISLSMHGTDLAAQFDGAALASISDIAYARGFAGLGVVDYADVQFDNFSVEPN